MTASAPLRGKEASELLPGRLAGGGVRAGRFPPDGCGPHQAVSLPAGGPFPGRLWPPCRELPRCCVFFGTTNTSDYLQDRTGNRRFGRWMWVWSRTQNAVWSDLPEEIDQLWAEAVVRWRAGEPFFSKGSWRMPPRKAGGAPGGQHQGGHHHGLSGQAGPGGLAELAA